MILGKGPTINLAPNIDRQKYITIGLNHVVEKYNVDITHAIDYEVIKDVGKFMTRKAKYLLMPWYPNMGFKPSTKNLEELCKEDPVLNTVFTDLVRDFYRLSPFPRHLHAVFCGEDHTR